MDRLLLSLRQVGLNLISAICPAWEKYLVGSRVDGGGPCWLAWARWTLLLGKTILPRTSIVSKFQIPVFLIFFQIWQSSFICKFTMSRNLFHCVPLLTLFSLIDHYVGKTIKISIPPHIVNYCQRDHLFTSHSGQSASFFFKPWTEVGLLLTTSIFSSNLSTGIWE
jgi:hypothetical protein